MFLGLASYRRSFISGLARIVLALANYLQAREQIVWTEVEETEAKMLLNCFTCFPVVALPNFNIHFFFSTDASDAAVWARLSHLTDTPKKRQITVCC